MLTNSMAYNRRRSETELTIMFPSFCYVVSYCTKMRTRQISADLEVQYGWFSDDYFAIAWRFLSHRSPQRL